MDVFDPRFITLIEVSGIANSREIIEKIERRKKAFEGEQMMQQQLVAQEAAIEQQVKQAKAAKDLATADKYSAEANATKLESMGTAYQYGQEAPPTDAI